MTSGQAWQPTVRNPRYRELVERTFAAAAFIGHIGVELVDTGPGWAESTLLVRPFHGQQDGLVHAGVLASIADHTAGAAAATLFEAGQAPLSAEFKINLLRPARADRIHCRGVVLKAGRTLSVVESEVFSELAAERSMVAKATVTIAVVGADSLKADA